MVARMNPLIIILFISASLICAFMKLATGKTVHLWTAMYTLTTTPAGTKEPYVSLSRMSPPSSSPVLLAQANRIVSVQRPEEYKAIASLFGHAAALIYPRPVLGDVGYHDPKVTLLQRSFNFPPYHLQSPLCLRIRPTLPFVVPLS